MSTNTNPFSYHRGYDDSYCFYLYGKPCLHMKYRILNYHACVNNDITSTHVYTCHLQLPDEILNEDCEIIDEYKFIITEKITIYNLPKWFLTWKVDHPTTCDDQSCEGKSDQEIYIPLSLEYVSSYQE